MTQPTTARFLADLAERTGLTYLETLLGLLLAGQVTDIVDLSFWQSAAVAALPAGLTVIKGAIGSRLGQIGTASWLPAPSDPTHRF
ncbi:hypothetical protein [Streptomyces sp. CC224B]|uniref:hypothetical protein n=1 Tax=Streptomyces sp. CC224B TaxID=3044571 RepID=UPI0024A9CDF0|nr:hypothetical protein [Streptomyces sp. CC224B]